MQKQTLKISYDPEANSLIILSSEKAATSTSLHEDVMVIADLAAQEGNDRHRVVALELIDPSVYFPLGKNGYDTEADVLLLGSKNGADYLVPNGDFGAYWRKPAGEANPVLLGVEVRSASRWLGQLLNKVPYTQN